jgi:MYXO-CTERM domain-containing protein
MFKVRAVSTLAVVTLMSALAALTACEAPRLRASDDDIVPSSTVDVDVIAGWTRVGPLLRSPVLLSPEGATRVGAIVRTAGTADVALFAADASAGDDVSADAAIAMRETWRDTDGERRVVVADLGVVATGIVVFVAEADVGALRSLTFEAVVPVPAAQNDVDGIDVGSGASTTTQAVLNGYEPRSAWGARAARSCDANATKTRITVHHTVSRLHEGGTRAQFSAEIRAAQALHMDNRGYCDIGYHFLVSADGTVWEGRNAGRLGAHTGSQNTNNLGVSFVGCFHPTSACNGLGATTPPQNMINGAGTFIGIAARHYGITLNVGSTLLGHRDNPGQATACPGDRLHQKLGELRTIANGGGGTTPPPAPSTGKIQGMVWDRGITEDVGQATAMDAKLPGTRVVIAQGSTTVQSVVARDGDAYWSFDVAPGAYVITASKDGFADATRSVSVAAGDNAWSSLGLAPVAVAVNVDVTVTDVFTGAPLPSATVQFGNDDPAAVDDDGRVRGELAAGTVTVTARAEGYVARTESLTLVAGVAQQLSMALTLDEVPPPGGEGEGEGEAPVDPTDPGLGPDGEPSLERLVIRNAPASASGGCGCNVGNSSPDAGAVVGVVLLLVWRRRRQGTRGKTAI